MNDAERQVVAKTLRLVALAVNKGITSHPHQDNVADQALFSVKYGLDSIADAIESGQHRSNSDDRS